MKRYTVKSVCTLAGLMLLTIDGNGEGLKNNIKVADENSNVFIINSIAMTSGRETIENETILSVDSSGVVNPVGKTLSII